VLYVSNAKSRREQNVIDRVLVVVSAPIQWLTASTLDGVDGLWRRYVALLGVERENEQLHEENARLKRDLATRQEQLIENGRLRLLVGLKQRAPEVKMLHARVIATSPTPLFRSLRIDKGTEDGLQLGAAVVNEDGIVGRVAAVNKGWADVMLLVDANSSTDVIVQRTRARARVRGTGSDVHLGLNVEYLARAADVEPGDVLVTSGTGTVFPKGLPIGTVMTVERGAFGLYQSAKAEPRVDFGKIESVLVVTGEFSPETSFEDSAPLEAPGVGPVLQPAAPTASKEVP
jgi:rod shape-determining protein MreC